MKTWRDLSPEQQSFLKSFLKTSILDIVRKKYKTETNKGIIAAFGRFSDLDALFVQRAQLVPDDYPEKALVLAQADVARARKDAGAFDDATQRMAPAIQAMERARSDLTDAAEALRNQAVAVSGVGFSDAARATIEQARQAVLQHLTDPLPTFAQMNTARAGLVAYQNAVNAAYAAAGEVPAARAALTQAADAANARLAEVADMDVTPFASAPQAAAIATEVQTAKDLQTAITRVDRIDTGAMRALAAELGKWLTLDKAKTLVDAATVAVIADVQATYDEAKENIDDAIDLDVSDYDGEPEESQFKATHAEVVQERQSHLSVLATKDLEEILKLPPLIQATERKANKFYNDALDVRIRQLKDALMADGVSAAHADGVVQLLEQNQAAGTEVMLSLERNETVLKGQEPTRTFIENQGKEATRLEGELKTVTDEWRVANEDFKLKLADFNTKSDAYALEKERVALLGVAATDEDRASVAAARQLREDARGAGLIAQTLKQEKVDDYNAKKSELDTAQKVLDAAKSQRGMLDAVTFGPLSPVAAHPIPADMVGDVVKLFEKNIDLASQTCALAKDAKDPKALAETALFMADQCDTNFKWQPPAGSDGVVPSAKSMSDENALNYAQNALRQTAYFGADFASEAQVAIANGVHFTENADIRALTDYSKDKVAAVRATQAAEAMIERTPTGVKIDLDSPAFNAMLMDRRHGYDAGFQPTTMMTEEMGKLQDFFGDPAQGATRKAKAEAVLNSVNAVPASPAARSLLSAQMGIPATDFDDPSKEDEIKEKIQIGILKAMATPVAQGSVGSCFATAPLRKLQNDDPIALMEMYRDIATKGTFTPKHGRPVPAVTRLPNSGEPMMRSLEYSIATAAARTKSSRERGQMNAAMFGVNDPSEPSLGRLEGELDADAWRKLEPQLQAAVMGGYTFVYDPTSVAGKVSADGSSSMGVYKMVAIDTKAEITSQSEFVAFIKRKALEAVKKAKLPDSDRDKVTAYIDDPAFVNGVDKLAGNNKPWQMQFGGWGDASGAILFEEDDGTKRPENLRGTNLVGTRSKDTTGERAVKVLKALSGMGGGDMTMVSTGGIHAFNAVAPNGAFAALSDPPGFDKNVQDMLIAPGLKIATDKLPADRATYLYNKRLDKVMPWAGSDAERDLISAAYATPPTTDMTPAELESYITTKLDAWKAASVQRKADAWVTDQKTPPDPAEVTKKKADLLAAENQTQKTAVTAMMAGEMGVPEFVVADSNWGSDSDKVMFVIAPDPLTGEPRMWQKYAVSGSMTPMDDKWLKTNWIKDE